MHKLLTTAAIALTLAFAGGAFADGPKMGQDGMLAHFDAAISKLPEAKAESFRSTMKQAHEQNESLHEQTRKLHEEIKAILTAPKFDKEAFLAKHKELQNIYDQMRTHMTEAFADAASKLSPEERKTLADSMRRPGHGMRGEHGKPKS